MNIFEEYLNKITRFNQKNQKLLNINEPNNFKGDVI